MGIKIGEVNNGYVVASGKGTRGDAMVEVVGWVEEEDVWGGC